MSQLTLVIGNKNYSSWSLRPWILLRHHELDFREKRVPLYQDTMENDLAEYQSDFKVPVLKDGDLVVWDSLSILEYVSEAYLAGEGWPHDRKVRAIARAVSSEMHSSFSALRSELPMNCRRKPSSLVPSVEAKQQIERVKSLWRRCRGQHGGDGEWLFGDFCIADAMFAPLAIRFTAYGVPLGGVEKEYVRSLLSHPAMAQWVEEARRETEVIEAFEIA